MRFAAISAVALIAIIIAIALIARADYDVLLDKDTDPIDRRAAYDALSASETNNYRIRVTGDQLLIDRRQKGAAILELSGLDIATGEFSYDYMAQASGFGVPESQRREYHMLQIKETLNKELAASPKIQEARVEIGQPNNAGKIYQNEIAPVTASVQLITKSALTQQEVDGVVNFVANAYPELSPDNIVVTDQYFTILNGAKLEPADMTVLNQQRDYEMRVQDDMNRALNTQFLPIFGAQHFTVNTSIIVDFDEKTEEEIIFTAPNEEDMEGLVVSKRELIESATGSTPYNQGGVPGADENGWEPFYPETGENPITSSWKSNTLEANYELNQLLRSLKEAKGKIVSLTASVAVDLNLYKDEDGEINFDQRQSEQHVRSLVAGVIGLKPGDNVNINVAFTPFFDVEKQQRMIEDARGAARMQEIFTLIRVLALYLLIGLCVALVIHRAYKFLRPPTNEDDLIDIPVIDIDDMDEYANLLKLTTAETEDIETTKSAERLKLEDFIDRSPDMVANLLRNWLSDDSASRGRH